MIGSSQVRLVCWMLTSFNPLFPDSRIHLPGQGDEFLNSMDSGNISEIWRFQCMGMM